ncbi:ABC transporter ATP-binding protein [Westiellopsis prolifica IICB1]|nr:ABC transporter ATP-binding protein [Westiellopsis prolifica IICB1]
MNLIGFLFRASWKIIALAAFTGSLSGICSAILIAVINKAVSHSSTFTNQQLFWGFVGLITVAFLSGWLSRVLLISLSQKAIYKLRLRLSSWILASPLRQLEELGSNRLLATLTEDTESISNAVFAIPFVIIDVTLIIGCLIYLGWLSWALLLVTLVSLALAIASIQFLITKAHVLIQLGREEKDSLFKHFRAITDGIKELKLHTRRRQAFLNEELEVTAASSRNYNTKSMAIFATAASFSELLVFIILGFLVFGLPKLTKIDLSIISGYVLTITYLIRPLQSILEVLPNLSQASVALQKVDKLGLSLTSCSEITSEVTDRSLLPVNSIELFQITYTYHNEKEESNFVIGPINLTFHPGEIVFIVGGNGSGKSTLAKIITGLYVPETGEIRLNAQPITQYNRENYRQIFSTVFADFYLFERILGINLRKISGEAQEYLQKLQLEHKVQIHEDVLSTINLSQGQRKRLALLTAYLEDRPIYLFDEWASDQDPFFREIFYKQLIVELKRRGKTVLVISHDDQYFHLADQIVKLDYGQLKNLSSVTLGR